MKFRIIIASVALLVAASNLHAQETTHSLTLTTYNIHSAIPNGESGAKYWPAITDVKNIADVLTTAGGQIIALQEVRNMWSDPKVAQPHQYPINMPLYLATLLDMNYAYGSGLEYVPRFKENREYAEWGNSDRWTNNRAPHGQYGNAVLTSFPITKPQIIKLPRGTDADAKRLGDEPRLALRVELKNEIPGLGKVIVYSTHFQHNNANTRHKQMRALVSQARDDLKKASGKTTATVFLMGDFNHHPAQGSDEFLAVAANAGFIDLAAQHAKNTNSTPHHTMISGKNKIRIDYIFCSRDVEISDVQVLESNASDHLPLSVTIKTH